METTRHLSSDKGACDEGGACEEEGENGRIQRLFDFDLALWMGANSDDEFS